MNVGSPCRTRMSPSTDLLPWKSAFRPARKYTTRSSATGTLCEFHSDVSIWRAALDTWMFLTPVALRYVSLVLHS